MKQMKLNCVMSEKYWCTHIESGLQSKTCWKNGSFVYYVVATWVNSGKLDNPNMMLLFASTTYGSVPVGCSKLLNCLFILRTTFIQGQLPTVNDALGTVTPHYSIIFICMLSVIELWLNKLYILYICTFHGIYFDMSFHITQNQACFSIAVLPNPLLLCLIPCSSFLLHVIFLYCCFHFVSNYAIILCYV